MDQGAVVVIVVNIVLALIVAILCYSNEKYWKRQFMEHGKSIDKVEEYAAIEQEKFKLRLDNEDFSKHIKKVNVLKLLGDRRV